MDIIKLIPANIGDVKVEKTIRKNSVLVTFHFKDNQRSHIKLNRHLNGNLFMFGLGLFAGEGSKKLLNGEPNFVELINSEPDLILFFLDFLEQLGFKREKLKARVQISCKTNEVAEKIKNNTKFWSSLTKISIQNFQKPNIRIRNNPKQKSIHGSLCIRLFSRPLWRLMMCWIKNKEWIAGTGNSGVYAPFEPVTYTPDIKVCSGVLATL